MVIYNNMVFKFSNLALSLLQFSCAGSQKKNTSMLVYLGYGHSGEGNAQEILHCGLELEYVSQINSESKI